MSEQNCSCWFEEAVFVFSLVGNVGFFDLCDELFKIVFKAHDFFDHEV